MLGPLRRLSRAWKGLRAFNAVPRNERKIVFYAEDGGYWSHFEQIFLALQREHSISVLYVTSCEIDPLLNAPLKAMRSFFIGEGSVRTFFFATLDVDVLVMTMPDLQTFHIKRSAHQVYYVYLHHSLVSTHMIYRLKAFDHFDCILCAGPHHRSEIRAREALVGLPKKELIDHGYGRLDSILSSGTKGPVLRSENEPIRLLVAPSWGKYGLLELHAQKLLEILLGAGFCVTVRPHPQTIKFKPSIIQDILDSYGTCKLFNYDNQPNSRKALFEADIMISDWSGAALEFAMGLERPVLFIDVPKKILNPEYLSLNYEPLEASLRTELGIILKPQELYKAPEVIKNMFLNRANWQKSSSLARKRWVFNEGESGAVGAHYLKNLVSFGIR